MTKFFFFISVLICLFINEFSSLSIYESFSVSLFIFYLLSFLDNLGKKLVILDIVVLNAIFICLLMPVIAYHHYTYHNRIARMWQIFMQVPSDEYYSFMIPATLALIIGLKLPIFFQQSILKDQKTYMTNVRTYLTGSKWQGLIMVAIGLFASVTDQFVPAVISHIFFLLRYLMFVGAFYCLFSDLPNKRLILVIVFGILIVRSIAGGMFGELLFMGTMTMILLVLGKKISFPVKFSFLALGVFAILIIQAVKPAYRKQTWLQRSDSKISLFTELVAEKVTDPVTMFTNEAMLFSFVARFNQGQVISRVIKAVPDRYPYANGETIYLSLAASVVPRFLWPDKPQAGGAANFKRFLGVTLRGYSIGLSPFGEAWGNFGKTGGIIFMLFFGLLFNFFFHLVLKISLPLPSLILWTPYFFFYACQIETDVVTMLNSFTKAAIFAFIFIKIFPAVFKLKI